MILTWVKAFNLLDISWVAYKLVLLKGSLLTLHFINYVLQQVDVEVKGFKDWNGIRLQFDHLLLDIFIA